MQRLLDHDHGAEVPNTAGLAGGWPGATVVQRFGSSAIKDGVQAEDGTWRHLGPSPE